QVLFLPALRQTVASRNHLTGIRRQTYHVRGASGLQSATLSNLRTSQPTAIPSSTSTIKPHNEPKAANSMLSQVVKRIDHVAIVVENLDAALTFYRDMLGIQPSEVIDFPREGVKIAILPLGGPDGSQIELLEPTDPTTGVGRFLETRG